MGAATPCNCSFIALLLCSQFLHPAQAFKEFHGSYGDEKVPLTVIVPDPLTELSPLAAPPPVSGSDDDGMRPRLPTERWRRRGHGQEGRRAHAPASSAAHAPSLFGPARAPALAPAKAYAPAPDDGSGTAFIKSSPAVPVPRGVTDTATILPMPAPGANQQDVGAASLLRASMLSLVVGFVIIASFGALC